MSPKRIFIAEDEAIVAADLEERLESLGYIVAGRASTGEEALQLIGPAAPDLILMDIMLQGSMDGVQTAHAIGKRHPTPIVYLTAHADDVTMKRAQLTGPFGYILKPFDERELHVAIEIALYRRDTEARLEQLNRDLEKALAQVKALRGLLPICAWCRKLRDDAGYWLEMEDYFRHHSDAEVTHGICPDCLGNIALTMGKSTKPPAEAEKHP